MPLSNAERQARYRQRLKARAASGDAALRRLNESYSAAAAARRDRILQELRMEMVRSTDRDFVLAMKRMMSSLPPPAYAWTLDDWCEIARQIGQKDEEASILEAREDALQQKPERPRGPWAPFSRVRRS